MSKVSRLGVGLAGGGDQGPVREGDAQVLRLRPVHADDALPKRLEARRAEQDAEGGTSLGQ